MSFVRALVHVYPPLMVWTLTSANTAMMFAIRLAYLNKKIQKLYQNYSQEFQLAVITTIVNQVKFESFNYEIVEIIHGIKKLLDIIVIAKYLDIEAQGKRFVMGI